MRPPGAADHQGSTQERERIGVMEEDIELKLRCVQLVLEKAPAGTAMYHIVGDAKSIYEWLHEKPRTLSGMFRPATSIDDLPQLPQDHKRIDRSDVDRE
jgi:hypothetical protein